MGDVRARRLHRLAGRGAERDLLTRALAGSAQRQPSAVVVHGEAGVGKTRLVQEVCDDPDLLVLWGSCVHFGGASVPYAPIIGVLQDWLAQADAAEQAMVLAGAGELSSLLPALGGSQSVPTARLIPLIDLVLNRIADRHRTVVVVDDLHWADLASLDVLAYLITGFRAQQLTVFGTSRDEDRGEGHPLHSWLADMRRMPSFDELHLERLDVDSTGLQLEYLLGQLPDIDVVNQVQARSDGNPYLTELLVEDLSGTESALSATVPDALRDGLLAAWHRLSPQARQLVRVLAVGGRPTSLPILTAVAGVHGVEVRGLPGCITEAQDRGVLQTGHGAPWFRHPLLAEVLYDGLPLGEAELVHATYLEVLESQSDPVEAVAADLAVHSQQAGRIDATYKWSQVAAEHAAMLRAPAEQAIQLERLCDLWEQVSPDLRGTTADRAALILRTSAICSRDGRDDRAIELLTQALNLVDSAREPLLAADLLVDRSTFRWHRTEPIEAVLTDLHAALELTAPQPQTAVRARALAQLGWAESWQRKPEAVTHADEAVQLAREVGEGRALATALALRSMVLSSDAPQQALADGQEAEQLGRACGAVYEWMLGVIWQCHALWNLGRRQEATEAALRNYADIAAPGRDLFAYFLAYLGAEGLLESGRWQECADLLRSGLSARCTNITGAGLRLTAASLAVRRGRLVEARQHLDRALELIPPTFVGIRRSLATGGAEVLLAEGQQQAAIDWLRARLTLPGAAAMDEDDDLLVLYAQAAAELARASRDAGDLAGTTKAVRILEKVLIGRPFTTTDPGDTVVQSMHRALFSAELARCRDDDDQPDRWQHAADACGTAGAPWHQAVAWWRCAEAAIAAGLPPVGVGDLLRKARRTALELGAEPLRVDVESLARRSRISLREPVQIAVPEELGTPLSALTSREREVLAFLVAGRSNGEIAKELFISHKTVSAHVSNILRKTGTAGRLEAAALAVRLDGPGA
ncbi:AAA family ATPase [Kribbella sp. NBC_00889]|uniref:helix-turn-helix transcriptional regulator n=1 Tax=Kribbella sp. NBC_00889 TaxID=2975974 RepID=UPI00386A1CEA